MHIISLMEGGRPLLLLTTLNTNIRMSITAQPPQLPWQFSRLVTVQRAKDEDQILAWANDCRFGLASSVWTSDIARAFKVSKALQQAGRSLQLFKDQVIFAKDEVLSLAGKPFSVFTPYKNAWIKRLTPEDVAEKKVGERLRTRLLPLRDLPKSLTAKVPDLAALGFGPGNLFDLKIPLGESGAQELFGQFKPRIGRYHEARDYPAARGPSYLSVHLRFGTVSIRELAAIAWRRTREGSRGAEVWLSELIWRDFYHQILFHHPHVVKQSFKPEYDAIKWAHGKTADAHFQAWCEGRTGYPLVDAAMAQINQTGYMHNRLRMVVASFLVKDLGIDWRWGEAFFALHLNDFDLAANNGGWQWGAGSGTDAAPYFRIFNPTSQQQKFDPDFKYIKKWVPEFNSLSYARPIVDHSMARERCLKAYKAALGR